MEMKHVLLEMYCIKEEQEKPTHCKGIGEMCIHNRCEYLACTYCPNEIAYTNELGIVESFDNCIGYGGEMEPKDCNPDRKALMLNQWKNICKKKIDEAYEDYMKLKND